MQRELASHLRSLRSVIFTGLLGIVGYIVQARSQKASEAQASLEWEAAAREEDSGGAGGEASAARARRAAADIGLGATTDHGQTLKRACCSLSRLGMIKMRTQEQEAGTCSMVI